MARASLDRIDRRILAILAEDGRRSYEKIAAEVGLSGPSVFERIRKLEARGVIRGFTVQIDPAAIGLEMLAFTWLTQAPGTIATDLTADFAQIPEIEECHHIAGEADYILKIRARDPRDLERVLRRIQTVRHVFTTETSVVFSSAFEQRTMTGVEQGEGPETT